MGFSIAIHALSGNGKSTLMHSAPGPRLVFDAEAARGRSHRFTQDYKMERVDWVRWRPQEEDIPKKIKDTAVVVVEEWADVEAAEEVLLSGNHPFRSTGFDSLTVIQRKLKKTLGKMAYDNWELLWSRMDEMIFGLAGACHDPDNPLDVLTILLLSEFVEDEGRYRPMVQGRLKKDVGAKVDVLAFAKVDVDEETGLPQQRLLIMGDEDFDVKCGLPEIWMEHGPVVFNPNLTDFAELVG